MIKTFILVLSLMLSAAANAELKDFTKQIYVVGVGQFKLKYFYSGEPVSRPRSLQIFVKCINSTEWNPVGEYKMCELTKYEYDAKTKKLMVNYIDGRVEPAMSRSHCDQLGNGELQLADKCAAPAPSGGEPFHSGTGAATK